LPRSARLNWIAIPLAGAGNNAGFVGFRGLRAALIGLARATVAIGTEDVVSAI